MVEKVKRGDIIGVEGYPGMYRHVNQQYSHMLGNGFFSKFRRWGGGI